MEDEGPATELKILQVGWIYWEIQTGSQEIEVKLAATVGAGGRSINRCSIT